MDALLLNDLGPGLANDAVGCVDPRLLVEVPRVADDGHQADVGDVFGKFGAASGAFKGRSVERAEAELDDNVGSLVHGNKDSLAVNSLVFAKGGICRCGALFAEDVGHSLGQLKLL